MLVAAYCAEQVLEQSCVARPVFLLLYSDGKLSSSRPNINRSGYARLVLESISSVHVQTFAIGRAPSSNTWIFTVKNSCMYVGSFSVATGHD